jgi:AraC family transcriptional regulator
VIEPMATPRNAGAKHELPAVGLSQSWRRHRVAQPLLCSATRNWPGITVELHCFSAGEWRTSHEDHLISLQLTACSSLEQVRHGRAVKRRIQAGDIIVTPLGEPKVWLREEEGEVLLIRIDPAHLRSTCSLASDGRSMEVQIVDNFGTRDPVIEAIARAMLDELRDPRFGSRLYVECLTTQLMLRLVRGYARIVALDESCPLMQHPNRKVRRAVDYIDQHLSERLPVRRLSELVAMSSCHFSHVFKHVTGVAPHQYVLSRRVAVAKGLLRASDKSLADIARQVGFVNLSHFSTAFGRVAGMTPTQYRSMR